MGTAKTVSNLSAHPLRQLRPGQRWARHAVMTNTRELDYSRPVGIVASKALTQDS